jgi:phosphoribosylformylglycinamidine cyclo-ligase
MVPPTRYRDAGVDIDAGDEAVRRIKRVVRSTFGPNVVTEIGSFAGASTVPGADPDILLLASMDGVGTKIKVAGRLGRYDTVGQDLVNHCVGDIGVHGADPLFFLDYVGSGRLDPEMVEQIVIGLAQACRENGCALIGGETAEMPGIYAPGDFDLVGCIVGTVRRDAFVDGSTLAPGDALLGFPSTGLHTNGFSLARKVLFEDGKLDPASPVPGSGVPLGDALLAVHRSYLPVFRALKGIATGFAHITGGGIPGNLNRILPPGTAARIDRSRWTIPPLFRLIAETGRVPEDDCFRTFNMGIGLIAGVPAARREEALARAGAEAVELGEVVAGSGEVRLVGEIRW